MQENTFLVQYRVFVQIQTFGFSEEIGFKYSLCFELSS